jgi:redox-sensitive bicupin YhaK (pirin superfamily)
VSALLQIAGREHDLGGGFMVRRLLPAAQRQAIGPFLFFDYFGPVQERPEDNHDVRPHPHIGLSTVTYLFEGAVLHRDSLGSVQKIEPGAINWMTSGRGIVHSERRPVELRGQSYVSHGIQLWAALPREHEEVEPSFAHTPAAAMPTLRVGTAQVRVLIGDAFGAVSPVATYSRTVYLDVSLPPTGTWRCRRWRRNWRSLSSKARCWWTVRRWPCTRWPCWRRMRARSLRRPPVRG